MIKKDIPLILFLFIYFVYATVFIYMNGFSFMFNRYILLECNSEKYCINPYYKYNFPNDNITLFPVNINLSKYNLSMYNLSEENYIEQLSSIKYIPPNSMYGNTIPEKEYQFRKITELAIVISLLFEFIDFIIQKFYKDKSTS